MAETSKHYEDSSEQFREELFSQLLEFAEIPNDAKTSLRQFLTKITASANNKALAQRLVQSATFYLSTQKLLNDEQQRVLGCLVEQLAKDGRVDPSATSLSITDRAIGQNVASCAAPQSRIGNDIAAAATRTDISGLCKTLENTKIATNANAPPAFTPETKKHRSFPPNSSHQTAKGDSSTLKDQYPFGHKILAKQGWDDKGGLGPDGRGIRHPIDPYVLAQGLDSVAGLGSNLQDENIQALTESKTTNIKTIFQDDCIIRDTWKDASKRTINPAPLETPVLVAAAHVTGTPSVFVRNITQRISNSLGEQRPTATVAVTADSGARVPPRGWIYTQDGSLKPDLRPRRVGNMESCLSPEDERG
ncbi:hypothetical protein F5Y19DRAFT_492324 [Xylariaceae sp. FL1651]|nr:hypothetical protein F5Y19DRAFT_492324 [Xylariaceae sp. FL1651]